MATPDLYLNSGDSRGQGWCCLCFTVITSCKLSTLDGDETREFALTRICEGGALLW